MRRTPVRPQGRSSSLRCGRSTLTPTAGSNRPRHWSRSGGRQTQNKFPTYPLPVVLNTDKAGVADYDFPIWYGLWAPAATPAAIADKLAIDVTTVLADPDLRNWFATHGAEPLTMTRTEFARFVRNESERAAQIIKDRGIALG